MKGLTIAAMAVGLAMGTSYLTGLRCNTTSSMPLGVWRVQTIKAPITRGEVVTLCLDPVPAAVGRQREYLSGGECPGDIELLIKTVAAVPGDRVTATAEGIIVNGAMIPNSKPLRQDDAGRPMRAVESGQYLVSDNQVWVIGVTDPRSFDSRYFGAVPISNIRGSAKPLWINQ